MPSGSQRDQGLDPPVGEQQAQRSPGQEEDQRLGEHLAQQPHPVGAESRPQRDLPLSGRHPGQQEVRHVRAGDQQDEADEDEQDQESRADLFDLELREGDQQGAPAGVGVRILPFEPAGDRRHLRPRLLHADSRLQAAQDHEVVGSAPLLRGVHRQRQPDLAPGRQLHSRGSDADHRAGFAIQRHGAPDDAGIGAETPPPEPLGEHHHPFAAHPVLAGVEPPPEDRLHLQGAKEVRRHPGSLERLGAVPRRQVERPGLSATSPWNDRLWRRRVLEVRHRDAESRKPGLGVLRHHDDQLVRLRIGQRLQQHAVDDAEDRAVGTDPQSQREQSGQGSSGALRQGAQPETDIFPKTAQEKPPESVRTPGILSRSDRGRRGSGGDRVGNRGAGRPPRTGRCRGAGSPSRARPGRGR